MSTRALAILALLLTMILWGSAAVFLRTLALSLSPENSLALRNAIFIPINIAGLALFGTWRIRREHWRPFLIAGLVGMGGYSWFVNAGFALVPAGLGTIINMAQPIMIALLAWAILHEKPSPWIWLGVGVAITGAVVLFWDDITAAVPLRGVIFLLISCAGWAVYAIYAKPLLQSYDTFTVTAVTILIAAPMLIAAASEPLPVLAARLSLRQWLEILYLVVPCGILGVMMWNYGAKHLSSAATGSFLYLIPVIAVICGALMLDEPITVNILMGGALILAGVAAAQFGPAMQRMLFVTVPK